MVFSLRWKIITAFGFIISATLILSGATAYWNTKRGFNILVSDESQRRTEQIVPLLEASYVYRNSWSGLDALIESISDDMLSLSLVAPQWASDVDWWQVTVDTIGIDNDTFYDEEYSLGTIKAVAEQHQIDLETIIATIYNQEAAAINQARTSNELTDADADFLLSNLRERIVEFIEYQYSADWYSLWAEQLNISQDALLRLLANNIPLGEVAIRHGQTPEMMVDVVLDAELQRLKSMSMLSDGEIVIELSNSLMYIWNIVDPKRIYHVENRLNLEITGQSAYLITSNLISGDDRLIITDLNGNVLYDSAKSAIIGAQLPSTIVQQGVALWDHINKQQIGMAILATGPNRYNAQQAAFLQGVGRSLLLSGVVVGLVVLIVGLFLARQMTAPILALTKATQQVANGEWETRLPIRSHDELGQMSAAFNRMATALAHQRTLRSRLISDLTHELHTPLSVISLEMDGLIDALQTPTEAAQNVQREIALLVALVDDLTLLLKTEADTLVLECEPLDLLNSMSVSIQRWQAKAEALGISLRLEMPPTLPIVVADRLRVLQIVGNLLNNALRHTPKGGSITVACECRDSVILTSIRDTGEGISATDAPHVFERFYRADASRNRYTGGRGLGLAIVQQLVELHGGRVWVESSLGSGSTFFYTLPIASV